MANENLCVADSQYAPVIVSPASESEDNDTGNTANKIRQGIPIVGYHDDPDDYFVFSMRGGARIVVDLKPSANVEGVQLQLYFDKPVLDHLIDYRDSPPYRIEHNGRPGKYYVVVYTESNHSSENSYLLRVEADSDPPHTVFTPIPDCTPTPKVEILSNVVDRR